VTDKRNMRMEQWWNATDRGKFKYLEGRTVPMSFVQHKVHSEEAWDRKWAFVVIDGHIRA
jgi:hypothetical protein